MQSIAERPFRQCCTSRRREVALRCDISRRRCDMIKQPLTVDAMAQGDASSSGRSSGDPQPPEQQQQQQQQAHDSTHQAEQRRLWMAAIKPPMYSVGFIPVLVAAAAVFAEHGTVPWLRCLGLVVSAILIIAWLNLSNDAFDSATGVDRTKRESVVNLTGGKQGLVLLLANLFLLAGAGLLTRLVASAANGQAAGMLVAAIACGYLYQGPPFRLSYRGLGEPLCFLAFGLLATPAFYLAMRPAAAVAMSVVAIPATVWTLAICVGVTTTIILFCSHFHQIEGDRAAGKQSPLVRLGTDRAVSVLKVAVALPYACVTMTAAAGVASAGVAPGTVALLLAASLLTVPAARSLVAFADANHRVPAAIAPLKIFATKLHMAWGLSLVLGLGLGRVLTA